MAKWKREGVHKGEFSYVQREKIAAMYRRGLSFQQIATEVGCSEPAVRRICFAFGVATRDSKGNVIRAADKAPLTTPPMPSSKPKAAPEPPAPVPTLVPTHTAGTAPCPPKSPYADYMVWFITGLKSKVAGANFVHQLLVDIGLATE